MKNVLVTGSRGFVGQNFSASLKRLKSNSIKVMEFTREDTLSSLEEYLKNADLIFHLAAVNRPVDPQQFMAVNKGLTLEMIEILEKHNRKPDIIYTSSTQVELDNLYGRSKREAEELLKEYQLKSNAAVLIYRLPNLFGKWCKPNYNSVVATFCHNLINDQKLTIVDENKAIDLVYIDDVVDELMKFVHESIPKKLQYMEINNVFTVTVGDIAKRLMRIHEARQKLLIPDLSDRFTRYLLSTYQSHISLQSLSYPLMTHEDERGSLAEILKSENAGQIFVSTTKPGVVRGNHYHDSKLEKFCVLKGSARIRLRKINGDEIIIYDVADKPLRVVDIPPGYTHSIENIGVDDMIVLFWASEVFSKNKPDTFPMDVTSFSMEE